MLNIIKNKMALIIMAIFSICYFSSSFFAKKQLNDHDFYTWNVFITLMSMSFSFCFLGSEQLFTRFIKGDKNRFVIQRDTIITMVISNAIYLIFLIFVVDKLWFNMQSAMLYLFVSLSSAAFVVIYNSFRVAKLFVRSQLANGFWKLAIIIFILMPVNIRFEYKLYLALLVSVFISISILKFSKLEICSINQKQPKGWRRVFFGFLLSLFVMMLLNNLDRVLVEKVINAKYFSEYVYMLSLTVLPFSLISSYVGFKELAYLKSKYNKSIYIRRMLRTGVVVIILYSVWFFLVSFFSDFLEVNLTYSYFLPTLLLVLVKCVYSYYSALFGLNASGNQMINSNIFTMISLIIMYFFVINLVSSVEAILYGVAMSWLIRCIIISIYMRKIDDYDYCTGMTVT
ncbi:hypothetical protein J4H73_12430 [Vibrio alginolyticus]|uniref:hypothetical protein n=1 Tax=Vibrio alginolyticus TaxID=663 RepID=UPI001BD64FBC|nr:hypothetical protein [Vibrio alginolyticus]MBT0085249.1 hypothetical protein [Vibrio alginolyticus]